MGAILYNWFPSPHHPHNTESYGSFSEAAHELYAKERGFVSPTLMSLKKSVAQLCNEDVLSIIFYLVDCIDVASCARVYKAWLRPARWHLYAHITFDASSNNAVSLASTLRSNVMVRSYIRRLTLSQCRRANGLFLFDWLTQLPASRIQKIDVRQRNHEPVLSSALSQCPALTDVNRLTLRGLFFSYETKLEEYINLPALESLCVGFPSGFHILSIASAAPLKRFSVITFSYDARISPLLYLLAPSLVRLDLPIIEWDSVESLADALIGPASP